MFKVPKPKLTLDLVNTTDDIIPASLMAQANPYDISNQATVYKWNITGVSYANPVAALVFWSSFNTSNISSRAGTIAPGTDQGLINLLNSFGIGNFWLSYSGGNTYVVTASNNIVFNSLTIGTAIMTIIHWSNTSFNSNMQILANAVLIINSPAPPGSGVVSVNTGDVITGNYIFGSGPPGNSTILIQKGLIAPPHTITTLYTDNGSSFGGIITPFVIDSDYIYDIRLTTP